MDKVEAKKNLEILEANKRRLKEYNHLYSSFQFKQECLAQLRQVNIQINNIKVGLRNQHDQ